MGGQSTLLHTRIGLRNYSISVVEGPGAVVDLERGRITVSRFASVGDLAEVIASAESHESPSIGRLPMTDVE